ncbi:MAG TPA: hypothetical protein DDX98_07245 [Bacteroidales bacterium]|jgi:integrase/recombinase XerD|nr:hypothetical protein [Bacteroidales bacterium]
MQVWKALKSIPMYLMSKNPQYSFNSEIQAKLKPFKKYLLQLGKNENTIRQTTNYTGYYLNWLEKENLPAEETRYNDMLNFIDSCHLEGKSKKHINSKLRSIRSFYEYLKIDNPNIGNPATNLYLKGIRQKLPSNIISSKNLKELYNNYQTETNRDKRNKVILGLLVYQGVTTEELHQLELNHLKLKEGKIYVPGNRRRNSRTLELKPCQILELHEYITRIRPKLLQQETDQLLISMEGKTAIKNSLYHMFRAIKKTDPTINSGKQIRASVITYWLKNYNLRQAQYMSGHKYVSSTERYQLNNLDKLQSNLEKYHPLK